MFSRRDGGAAFSKTSTAIGLRQSFGLYQNNCAPRIRCWRASATDLRVFKHNPPLGDPWPSRFNLRHYPMRSREQMLARILRDRAGLRRGDSNRHYGNMKLNMNRLEIASEQLHL